MKFFQTLIASILGTLLALALIFIILLISFAGSAEEAEPYIRDNTVLKMHIQGALPDRNIVNPVDQLLNPGMKNKVSLQTLKNNLQKAAVHDKIQGVLLEIDFVTSGWANLQEAHRLISAFRDSSDKFVYAMTNDLGYNEQGYYLATAADSVFSPPESFFEFDGFYSQVMFYTGLFEKIGVEAEITRSGKYKSAVEPFINKELSEESRYQLEELLADVSSAFVSAVGRKTGKTEDEINALLNNPPTLMAQSGYRNGLIDSLLYKDQLDDLIRERIGLDEGRSFHTVSNSRYYKVSGATAGLRSTPSSDRIAVIYASGEILPDINNGSPFGGQQQYISASWFRENLEKVRDDNNVKALVVRINSPGGSGTTSDAIWRMLQETREDIPVIVSMGSVAASGGYYIAMASDSIVAEPTTITGSIGVFSTKFNLNGLFNEKLGITFDEVKTHPYADWLDPTSGLTATEQKAFQQYTDEFYATFIGKVAEARGMTTEAVDAVAQGRVWTGEDAKAQNLVDLLGGLDKALEIAAEKAGLTDYRTVIYPEQKSFYELLLGSAQAKVRSMLGDSWFDNAYMRDAQQRLSILKRKGPLLLFPYEINIQ